MASCKPRKGKAKCKVVNGKKISYGQKGAKIGKVGSKRQKAFCKRHAKNNGVAGKLSKARWKC